MQDHSLFALFSFVFGNRYAKGIRMCRFGLIVVNLLCPSPVFISVRCHHIPAGTPLETHKCHNFGPWQSSKPMVFAQAFKCQLQDWFIIFQGYVLYCKRMGWHGVSCPDGWLPGPESCASDDW